MDAPVNAKGTNAEKHIALARIYDTLFYSMILPRHIFTTIFRCVKTVVRLSSQFILSHFWLSSSSGMNKIKLTRTKRDAHAHM